MALIKRDTVAVVTNFPILNAVTSEMPPAVIKQLCCWDGDEHHHRVTMHPLVRFENIIGRMWGWRLGPLVSICLTNELDS